MQNEDQIITCAVGAANGISAIGPAGQRNSVKKAYSAFSDGEIGKGIGHLAKARGKAALDVAFVTLCAPLAIPANTLLAPLDLALAGVGLPFSRKFAKNKARMSAAHATTLLFMGPRLATSAVAIISPEATSLCRTDLLQRGPTLLYTGKEKREKMEKYGYELDKEKCQWVKIK